VTKKASQPELTPQPRVAPAPLEMPAHLEYRELERDEIWRVEKFELLAAEFGFAKAAPERLKSLMRDFHASAATYERGWLLTRRLFGVMPALPPAGATPDDLRAHLRGEVGAEFGIDAEQLQAELDAVRAIWDAEEKRGVVFEKTTSAPPSELLEFTDEDALKEFGFSDRMFETTIRMPDGTEDKRPAAENRIEREWFAKRVRESAKMLRQPFASSMVREALMNELYLSRLRTEMGALSPTSTRFEGLQRMKSKFEESLAGQMETLQEMFPEIGVRGQVSFSGALADLFTGYREFKARKDMQLLDRVRTAGEIEVELRQSVQDPQVRYRLGLNVAIVEAIHALYDPNFRTQFNPATLKKLDAGFREAAERVRAASDEKLVDLEKGTMPGEGEEYPDLVGAEGA
jgi:hypothetical protein